MGNFVRKLIKWNTGEGNIVADYDQELEGTIKFTSDTINEDLDREQYVTVKTSDLTKQIKVTQTGKREIFQTQSEEFITKDGTFNVLKDGISK